MCFFNIYQVFFQALYNLKWLQFWRHVHLECNSFDSSIIFRGLTNFPARVLSKVMIKNKVANSWASQDCRAVACITNLSCCLQHINRTLNLQGSLVIKLILADRLLIKNTAVSSYTSWQNWTISSGEEIVHGTLLAFFQLYHLHVDVIKLQMWCKDSQEKKRSFASIYLFKSVHKLFLILYFRI